MRRNSCIAVLLIATWPQLGAAKEVDEPGAGLLETIELCLSAVRSFRAPRDIGRVDRVLTQSSFAVATLSPETRGDVTVTTCHPDIIAQLPSDLWTQDVEHQIQAMADAAGLLRINRVTPGMYFADCQNVPNACYGFAVTPIDDVWTFLTVGAPCAHSYGKH